MVGTKWRETLVAALMSAGMAWGQQEAVPPAAKGQTSDSVMTLQEPGKPDQKVKILKTYRTADGKTAYDVQDLTTGAKGTITETGSGPSKEAMLAPATVPHRRSLLSRLFGRDEQATVPTAAPSTLGTMPKAAATGTVTTADIKKDPKSAPAPSQPAQPSDWHLSWGKTHDSKMADAAKADLPQAEINLADPLKDPVAFPNSQSILNAAREKEHTGSTTVLKAPISPESPPVIALPTNPAKTAEPAVTTQPAKDSAVAQPKPAAVPAFELPSIPETVPAIPVPVPEKAVANLAEPAVKPDIAQGLAALRNAPLPTQREKAVETLTTVDWHRNRHVVFALMQAIREDPEASVRIACIHSLVQMKVDTVSVTALLQTLKDDPDVRVRQEADTALRVLNGETKRTGPSTGTTSSH
jgi:hypothetical protein